MRLFKLDVIKEMMDNQVGQICQISKKRETFKSNLFKESITTIRWHYRDQCTPIMELEKATLKEYCIKDENTFLELKAGQKFCLEGTSNHLAYFSRETFHGAFVFSGRVQLCTTGPNPRVLKDYKGVNYIPALRNLGLPLSVD